jgi:hypothetical protein
MKKKHFLVKKKASQETTFSKNFQFLYFLSPEALSISLLKYKYHKKEKEFTKKCKKGFSKFFFRKRKF